MAKPHSITYSTDLALDRLGARATRYEACDLKSPGLRVRVTPRGAKTFIWNYREGNNVRRHTLGRYGEHDGQLSLAQARKRVSELQARLAAGILPNSPGNEIPRTVGELAERFYAQRIEPTRKSAADVRRILDNDVLPAIGKRKLNAVTTAAVGSIIQAVVDRGAKAHAEKVLAVLKQMLRYGAARGFIEYSPAEVLRSADFNAGSSRRQRALDVISGEAQAQLTEIPKLWHALDAAPRLSLQVSHGLKLLLLLGVRSGELRLATWDEFDLDNTLWTIPVDHQKLTRKQAATARPFVVPIPPMAVELLAELKEHTGDSPYVLRGKSDDAPLDDKALGHATKRLLKLKDHTGELLLDIPAFTPHDLRRTLRTHLARLRVPPHVAESCLNHSLGAIVQTYDTHGYLDERRDALETWAACIDRAVNPQPNVIEIGAAS